MRSRQGLWIFLACCLAVCGPGCSASAAPLELRFLNVGQGDAALVRMGDKAILIDAGPAPGMEIKLRELGVRRLDLMLISHNHLDHFGGAVAILDALPVRFFMDNGRPATGLTESQVLAGLSRGKTTYLKSVARTFNLEDAELQILTPPLGMPPDEQNNQSLVAILKRGKFSALLSGDSERTEIRALLAAGAVPHVDVLKAAHHGSGNGLTEAWLTATDPRVVVISVGADNTYGHPDPVALQRYGADGRRVLRTDLDGDVVISIDAAGTYQVRRERSTPIAFTHPFVNKAAAGGAHQRGTKRACCVVCRHGRACGDSCVSVTGHCSKPRGCACDE